MSRYIDADEASRILSHLILVSSDYLTEDRLFRWIDMIPTVDAEPVRHGRWYSVENYMDTSLTMYVCSECGSMSNREDNYCWHCGADMRGVHE